MIRSMTGYGEAHRDGPAGRLRVEIKTVNHRFFSVNVRVPPALDRHEVQVRDWLRTHIARGHVNCSVRFESANGLSEDAARLEFDEGRARAYVRVLRELGQRLDLPGQVDVALLAQVGGLSVSTEVEEGVGAVSLEALRGVIDAAAAATVGMREQEGRRLAADLEARLGAIEAALEVIAERAPARLVAERDRLRAAVAELAGDIAVDEERLAREIAYLAERWDVSEELVRLRSHIELFRQTVADGAAAEPVGKRLAFLNQEMHREANTIGSKSNDAVMEHQVVAIKNEIERLREQIENVE